MSYKGGADKDLFSHISATFSLNAFFGLMNYAQNNRMTFIGNQALSLIKKGPLRGSFIYHFLFCLHGPF
jgi:hypothetical protein